MSIPVIVQKSAAGSPACGRAQQAGFAGNIGEGPISVISIEDILPPIGHKQVVEAVVVVVANAHAACPAGFCQARFYRDVAKGAVPVVVVEPVGDARGGAGECASAKHQDVDPAIVVVVEKGASATNRFQDVVLGAGRTVKNGMIDSRLLRHLDKMGVVGQAGSFPSRLHCAFVRNHTLTERRSRRVHCTHQERSS